MCVFINTRPVLFSFTALFLPRHLFWSTQIYNGRRRLLRATQTLTDWCSLELLWEHIYPRWICISLSHSHSLTADGLHKNKQKNKEATDCVRRGERGTTCLHFFFWIFLDRNNKIQHTNLNIHPLSVMDGNGPVWRREWERDAKCISIQGTQMIIIPFSGNFKWDPTEPEIISSTTKSDVLRGWRWIEKRPGY